MFGVCCNNVVERARVQNLTAVTLCLPQDCLHMHNEGKSCALLAEWRRCVRYSCCNDNDDHYLCFSPPAASRQDGQECVAMICAHVYPLLLCCFELLRKTARTVRVSTQ
jgi:hypothetical protein